jgi:hypothetical protein
MQTSIEISYYPLQEEFKTPIKKFIEALKKNKRITVKPNSMSTQVFGEFDDAMVAVTQGIKEAFELPNGVFTLKIINSDRNK